MCVCRGGGGVGGGMQGLRMEGVEGVEVESSRKITSTWNYLHTFKFGLGDVVMG